jgi:hypothetical protein
MKRVKSSIPQGVIEKTIRDNTQGNFLGIRVVDCFLGSDRVGQRVYNHDSIMIMETPLKNGLKHGREITWGFSRELLSIEPYVNGKIHGTTKQYGRNGKVIGTYKMVHGTGFDVWRQECGDNQVFVSEIHTLKDGFPNGYEWWFASSKGDLFHERHWQMGKLHGIERMWNSKGRLKRGYPKYFITGQKVSKQKYVRMAVTDETLPNFRGEDNLPYRSFPSDIMIFMWS